MNSNTSFIIRPIEENDLATLYKLVGKIGDGLTSLPKDNNFLQTRIHESLRSFYPKIYKPGGEFYLFVLENLETKEIVGTSGLLAKVGGFEPFYTYKIVKEEAHYEPLNITACNKTLQLKLSYSGPSELCSLFLHPDSRKGGLGRLLSFSRFLFMKSFPERFDNHIIAELRGYIDENGESPFWNAVGAKFFQKDYYTADILSGLGNKDFIGALMPKHPIYMSLLPSYAREVIGKVHKHTEPAMRILLEQGFTVSDEVDIFDAGPLLKANREEINFWKMSRFASFQTSNKLSYPQKAIIAKSHIDYRACIDDIEVSDDLTILIRPELLEILNLNPNDKLIYALL